jgi:hypothetical protein
LLVRANIKATITELSQRMKAVAVRKFDITAERVLRELACIAFANADDYFAWGTQQKPIFRGGRPVLDAAGNPVMRPTPVAVIKPSSQLTREQKAVAGIEMGAARDGTPTINVKLADKRGALRDPAQHLGLLEHVGQHRHEHHVLVENAAAELQQRIALLTSRAREPIADAEVLPVGKGELERAAAA